MISIFSSLALLCLLPLLVVQLVSLTTAQFISIPGLFDAQSIVETHHTKRKAPFAPPNGFSDQSAHVALQSSGALIATADFNRDRFIDLLMLDSRSLRKLSVMQWQHDSYSFRHVGAGVHLDTHPFVKNMNPPFRKITSVHVADFGNDGTLDLLVMDGSRGIIFFGDGLGNFNNSPPVLIPQLPPTNALVDANADLVPDIFVEFENHTRGFYIYERATSVEEHRFNQTGSIKFIEWKHANYECEQAKSSIPDATSIAFADMDGDCLPDLVMGTNCGIEIWLNAAASHRAFWDLNANGSDVRRFDRSMFDYKSGDYAMTFADFDADGTMDIAVVNKKRKDVRVHRNIQPDRPTGLLCTSITDFSWKMVQAIGKNEISMHEARLGPLFGGISVAASLRVGDFDVDGWPDLLGIDAATSQPMLFRNVGNWDKTKGYAFERAGRETERGLRRGNSGTVAVGFFDTDESGRQDIMVVRGHNETRLIWNKVDDGWERLFFKGTILSGLGFHLEPRPFAPVVGNTVKVSYMERGSRRRRRRICSQAAQNGGWRVEACSCYFGVRSISNYIEELWVGAGATTKSWTNLMPNSMAVVWAEGGGMYSYGWWMEYFTQRRGGPMLRVVGLLSMSLVVLGVVIAALQHNERKRDRRMDETERLRLFNFG